MIVNNFFAPKFNKILLLFIAFTLFNIANNKAIAKMHSNNWLPASSEIKKICKSVKDVSIPPQDSPHDAEKKLFAGCDSGELYYGFKAPIDYVKARKCSILNNQLDILMMIYANGKGVDKNVDLAIHFACMLEAAPAEVDGRINHLIALKKHPNTEKDFSICDDITTEYMMGYCLNLQLLSEDKRLKENIKIFIKSLTTSERKAFKKVQNTSKIYLETSSLYGTPAITKLEEMDLNNKIIELFDKTIQCKFPSYDIDVYQKADKQLNLAHKKAKEKSDPDSNIAKSDITEIESTWITYRDSWINLGHLKCPEVSNNTWNILITQQRIELLKK